MVSLPFDQSHCEPVFIPYIVDLARGQAIHRDRASGACSLADQVALGKFDRADIERANYTLNAIRIIGQKFAVVVVAVEVEGIQGQKCGIPLADGQTARDQRMGLHRASIIRERAKPCCCGIGNKQRVGAAVQRPKDDSGDDAVRRICRSAVVVQIADNRAVGDRDRSSIVIDSAAAASSGIARNGRIDQRC